MAVRIKHDASANAAAAITVAGANFVDWVAWSYSGTPTAGGITISVDGSVIFNHDITVGGPGQWRFEPAIGALGTAVVITLAKGGTGVTGKVTAMVR